MRSRRFSFRLGPDQLAVLDRDLERAVEPGMFKVYVGASSRDLRLGGELVVE